MIMDLSGLQLPRSCQEKTVSLSMMAETCLGRPLDKSMQVSRQITAPLLNLCGVLRC